MVSESDLKPLDPQLFVNVHAQIGLALWHTQAFEDTLCYFVTLILKLPASRAEAEVRAVLEKTQSKTLGSLIAELRKAKTTTSVSEFEQRVGRFLDERNWLVHASWRQHHGDLYNPELVAPLMCRLEAIANEAFELQQVFRQIGREWTLQQGVSSEILDAEARRILIERGAL